MGELCLDWSSETCYKRETIVAVSSPAFSGCRGGKMKIIAILALLATLFYQGYCGKRFFSSLLSLTKLSITGFHYNVNSYKGNSCKLLRCH